MSYKKVGIAQDSNLRGDSVRVQNPTNTFAYAEFSYDGSATYSVKYPSTSGQAGNALVLVSPNEYIWGGAVGATGATGTSGSSGSSGSSGQSGTSGSSGSSGTAGTSGTSGVSAVYNAVIASPVNFVPGIQAINIIPGLSFTAGQSVLIYYNSTNYCTGIVQSYDINTGLMTVDITSVTGTGTLSPTTINLASGLNGSSGSSGSSGQDGSSGSSGSSGANGVGDATMLGTADFVSKYVGATALGTASLRSIGSQIIFQPGVFARPSITYDGFTSSGINLSSGGLTVISASSSGASFTCGGSLTFYTGVSGVGGGSLVNINYAPTQFAVGVAGATPSMYFTGDSRTGLLRPSAGIVAIQSNGATAAIFGSASSTIFSRTTFARSVDHVPVTNTSVSGTYSIDMSSSNVFILTLTASSGLTTTNERVGSYVIIVNQNATGGYNLNLQSGKFVGANAISIGTASNAKSILQVIYDGTTSIITSQKNLTAL
jgi:hypothetical protein